MFRKSSAAAAALCAIAVAIVPSAASAQAPSKSQTTVCAKAFGVRTLVIARHGKRAPGRNICRFGVLHSNDVVSEASYDQKKRYLLQLRALIAPAPPYSKVTAGLPAQSPAGTLTAHITSAGYAIPAYIVQCESGGNPRAVNTSNPNRPAGLYQIITSTWIGAGGGQFAPTADQATEAEQGIIAARIYDGGRGAGQWECA